MIHSSMPKKASRLFTLLGLSLAALLIVAAVLMSSNSAAASSHREAPAISKDAFADNTDTYVWIPQGQTDNIVLAASWIPFEGPEGGPNYFEWDDSAYYDIYVDTDGDASPDITYTLRSTTEPPTTTTFLYNTGPIESPTSANWHRAQTYDLTETRADGTVTVLCDDCAAPPVNIGSKSTPDYESLVQQATYMNDGVKMFAGPTDDAFFVDLQVFDLLTLRGQGASPVNGNFIGYETGTNTPVDSLAGFNVHSLVIEAPISRLVASDTVLGVWSTTRRDAVRTFGALGAQTTSGDPVQVSRLGMPLVNEVVIPLGAKDIFNSLPPSADLSVYAAPDTSPFAGLLQNSVENPEVGRLLCALYGVPMPQEGGPACNTAFDPANAGGAGSGRGDIFQIFLTGIEIQDGKDFTVTVASGDQVNINDLIGPGETFNLNKPATVQPAEMIRINTAVKGDLCSPSPHRLGVFGGDACGYPNGRRLTDDTVEISLLAVAGAAYELLDDEDDSFTFLADPLIGILTDGIDENDVPLHGVSASRDMATFPYFANAQSGQSHIHTNGGAQNTTVQLGSMFGGNSAMPVLEIGLALLVLTGFVMVVYTRRYRQN